MRYYQELMDFVARRTGDDESAADLVQETYARTLALPPKHDGPDGPPPHEQRAVLYRTARHLLDDQQRQHLEAPVLAPAPVPPADVPAPPADQPETRAAVRQQVRSLLAAIDALPPRCREAFVLFKIEGLPQAEIAERMGISRNMVEKHVIAGMQACRRSLPQAAEATPGLRGPLLRGITLASMACALLADAGEWWLSACLAL